MENEKGMTLQDQIQLLIATALLRGSYYGAAPVCTTEIMDLINPHTEALRNEISVRNGVLKEYKLELEALRTACMGTSMYNVKLTAENEALRTFKTYVHDRLDKMGIEKDPESEHKAAGCRIGGRLDIVEALRKELEDFKTDYDTGQRAARNNYEALRKERDKWHDRSDANEQCWASSVKDYNGAMQRNKELSEEIERLKAEKDKWRDKFNSTLKF